MRMVVPINDRDMAAKLRPHLTACHGCGQSPRPEAMALLPFLVRDAPIVGNAVDLFWDVYEPTESSASPPYRRPACPPSEQLERDILDSLDRVYGKFRVPYEPDADNFETLQDLVIHLHVAATRAFAIKRADRGQLSEEVVSCLREVERTAKRIQSVINAPGGQAPYESPISEVSIDALQAVAQFDLDKQSGVLRHLAQFFDHAASAEAIWALVQVELSRVSRRHGEYANAIHYLNQASISYICALYKHEDSEVAEASVWRNRLKPLDVTLSESVGLVDLLQRSPPADVDWNQVTRGCAGLAILPEVERGLFSGIEEEEEFEDEEGVTLSWSEFWNHARGWASAQLSPSEYRKIREEEERHAAERRLKRYFFYDTWAELPCRAKRRLINADVLLNSPQRVAVEAMLNDLRIATEEICYQVIWEPLVKNKRPSLEFLREKAQLEESRTRRYPSIADYTRICQQKWYCEFLAHHKLDKDDVRFLTKDLPSKLSQLKSERNLAEHEITRPVAPGSPQTFYRGFLGIRENGVLPQLAGIGRKVGQSGR